MSFLAASAFALTLGAAMPARDRAAVRAFKKANPCPYSKVEGCIVDHVVPLCAGGRDAPENMQWQTVASAKEKDRHERRLCAARRRPPEAPPRWEP